MRIAKGKKKAGRAFTLPATNKKGHRATLPQGDPCSTIADVRLNFGVRNGIRCFPHSMDTPNRAATDSTSRFR